MAEVTSGLYCPHCGRRVPSVRALLHCRSKRHKKCRELAKELCRVQSAVKLAKKLLMEVIMGRIELLDRYREDIVLSAREVVAESWEIYGAYEESTDRSAVQVTVAKLTDLYGQLFDEPTREAVAESLTRSEEHVDQPQRDTTPEIYGITQEAREALQRLEDAEAQAERRLIKTEKRLARAIDQLAVARSRN